MTVAYFYDDTQYRQALSPANAVQCLRGAGARANVADLWGGSTVNVVYHSPRYGSGALLMMGRTDELYNSLNYAYSVNNIQRIWCSDDSLVVFYVRCRIGGSEVLGRWVGGNNHTVVSIAPLSKYWNLQRNFLTTYGGYNTWYSMYPWNQQDAEIFNGGIDVQLLQYRIRQVGEYGPFQGLYFP